MSYNAGPKEGGSNYAWMSQWDFTEKKKNKDVITRQKRRERQFRKRKQQKQKFEAGNSKVRHESGQ